MKRLRRVKARGLSHQKSNQQLTLSVAEVFFPTEEELKIERIQGMRAYAPNFADLLDVPLEVRI